MKHVFAAIVLLAAGPAAAQSGSLPAPRPETPSGDWDLHRDERTRSFMAYTVFSNGLGIAFRCLDGSLGAVVSGLPPAREERQTLRLQFREDEAYDSGWTTTTDPTVAVGDYPAPLAREFRQGGELRLTVPRGAADGRNLQFAVELPPSSAAIDAVLTACERPLVDPRDAELDAIAENGLPYGLTWARPPRPSYPSMSRYAAGFVVTSCITNPDGSLRDCQVEMQHPQDSAFGEATLRAIRRARVQNLETPGAPLPTVRVAFRSIYRMR